MSTRACYTFRDDTDTIHIYKHSDGYPTGAVEAIKQAMALAWPLPRFEAGEMAAAFVAIHKLPYWAGEQLSGFFGSLRDSKPRNAFTKDNKYISRVAVPLKMQVPTGVFGSHSGGGEVRIMKSGNIRDVAPWDIAYRYEIGPGNDGTIRVIGYSTHYSSEGEKSQDEEEIIINCPLAEFEFEALAAEMTQNPYSDNLLYNDSFRIDVARGGQIDLTNNATGAVVELPLSKEQLEARVKKEPEMRSGYTKDLEPRKQRFMSRLWAEFKHLAKTKRKAA